MKVTSYGLIGDAHLGFKAYDSERRTQEVSDTFAAALECLKDEQVVMFAGDLFDDTTCPNKVKKDFLRIKQEHEDQVWVILGGNHDSTKTYSSVSVLDAVAEVSNIIVINAFEKEELNVAGLNILAIPHMKSNDLFLDAIDKVDGNFDVCLLHCMVDSGIDLSPNDLNIDTRRLEKLATCCDQVWIGHQHGVHKCMDNVRVPGGIAEFNFGEVGDKFVYRIDCSTNSINAIPIPAVRRLKQIETDWTSPLDLLNKFSSLDVKFIYKLIVSNIPSGEYSSAKATIDVIRSDFAGDLIYVLNKLGHEEMVVTEIDASFDLLDEFAIFSEALPYKEEMRSLLIDSISEVLSEEEA